MEYAVAHFDVRFVLKTDDDAFINVQPLIQQLKLLCETPNCQNERMYMVWFYWFWQSKLGTNGRLPVQSNLSIPSILWSWTGQQELLIIAPKSKSNILYGRIDMMCAYT